MKIIVCAKQVPDTDEVKIDQEKGTLIRNGVPSILNPDDANALEEALSLKNKYENTNVTVITMGPPQAKIMLRECLAMGADDAILLSDREFAGSDTWATSNTLATAIKKIGGYELIFAGRQAIDGDTAQVGPQIAERLNIPQVTYVQNLNLKDDLLTVQRQLEDGYEVINVKKPALLTTVDKLNEPRYMSVKGIFENNEKDITVWSKNDLKLNKKDIGLNASPTKVFRSFAPEAKGDGVIFDGNTEEIVKKLVISLKEKNVI